MQAKQRAMKSISMMTSAEIRQHRTLLGKVFFVTVQHKGHVSDIEEFSEARAWASVGETYTYFPKVIDYGWRSLSQEASCV